MKLYFLRHGVAEARIFGKDDYSRNLTQEGLQEMERLAEAFKKTVSVEKIFSSDLLRAKKTAMIIAEALGAPLEIDNRINSGASYADFHAIFTENQTRGSIMFVGHEPDISTTISQIIGHAKVEIKKSSLAVLEVDENFKGALISLIPAGALLS